MAATLAGLLFVSLSVNQVRILSLGHIAERGSEALCMLFLTLVAASLPLVPGQPLRLLGAEILAAGIATLLVMLRLQRLYHPETPVPHRRRARLIIMVNRLAVSLVAAAGLALLCLGTETGFYFLPLGILLTFAGAGITGWVLLIEINR